MSRRSLIIPATLAAVIGGALAFNRPARFSLPVPRSTESPAPTRNLLLITIDTLRADRVGSYGYAAARTPTLDALAVHGVRFDRAFATAPITLTSHASLLTGRYPPRHGARHNGMRLDESVPTLATILKANRFATAAFVAAFPLDHRFGTARGFDVYGDRLGRGSDGRPRDERPGSEVIDDAIVWLGHHSRQRFFLWVHLFEPHAPYVPRPMGSDVTPPTAGERYDGEIAVADREIARLIGVVRGSAAATLTIAAGDHGEAFGENGEIGHSIFVYETTLRVPLLIAGPGIDPRTVTGSVSVVDVAPTALAFLGVAAEKMDGVDLRPAMRGRSVPARELYAESFAPLLDFGWSPLRALRSGPWKFIAAPREELYNLQNDPAERTNLIGSHPVLRRGFEERVARYSGPELDHQAGAGAMRSAADLARLHALGYVGGSGSLGATHERPDPKDRRRLAAAIAQVTSGELQGEKLRSALEQILTEDPRNGQAHLRLGFVLANSGRCTDAEPHFTSAIAAHLPSADPFLGLAGCQAERRDLAGAESTLVQASKVEPGNPVVTANLGMVAAQSGRLDAAIASFRAALAVDPDLHEARFNLARAYGRAGRRADAAAEARELLSRLPSNSPQRAEVERLLEAVR